MTDPYVLPNGTLRNLLGITDPEALAAAEADITSARLVLLDERPLSGTYDLAHLQRFHGELFGDIYDWAGRLRTIDISKQTPFCPERNLPAYAGDVFGRLRAANWLRQRPRAQFVSAVAELYGDINALHPFREGNGRTQRAFLAQLSAAAGWPISWAGIDPQENREACVKSFFGDNGPLERMFHQLVCK